MNAIAVSALIGTVTFVLSVLVSAFVAGAGWGRVKGDIADLRQAVGNAVSQDSFNQLAQTVSEIKGMFRLTLKEGPPAP